MDLAFKAKLHVGDDGGEELEAGDELVVPSERRAVSALPNSCIKMRLGLRRENSCSDKQCHFNKNWRKRVSKSVFARLPALFLHAESAGRGAS